MPRFYFHLFVVCCLATIPKLKANKQPNVLILIADQLRYQSIGLTDDRAITPNIDKLASEGMWFQNFVSSTPVCTAFRGSLMTGKFASSTGIVVNELRMNPNHDTFAHVLKKASYKTDHIGKWHLWANKAGGHFGPQANFIPPGPYRMGFDDFWAAYNFGHRNFKYSYCKDTPEEIHIEGEFKATHFTNLAIDRLKEHAESEDPFAMVVAYSPLTTRSLRITAPRNSMPLSPTLNSPSPKRGAKRPIRLWTGTRTI